MENLDQKNKYEEIKLKASPIEAMEVLRNSFEISPALDDGSVICVIKPDAFEFRDAIVERMEGSGLYIVRRTVRNLSENFVVNEMYGDDNLPKPIAEATKKHFLSGPSEIILVRGENTIAALLDLVGLKTEPSLCEPETIRYVYGDHVPQELEGGYKYYQNAAHRPKNTTEARKDLEKFKDII